MFMVYKNPCQGFPNPGFWNRREIEFMVPYVVLKNPYQRFPQSGFPQSVYMGGKDFLIQDFGTDVR
jgi:hypothetical protein